MAEPRFMVSLIQSDDPGSRPAALEDIDFWRIVADRIPLQFWEPSSLLGSTNVSDSYAGLLVEAVSAVGISFSFTRTSAANGAPEVRKINVDAIRSPAQILPVIDDPPGDRVSLWEVGAAALLVSGVTRRSVLRGMAAATAVAYAGCKPKPPPPPPVPVCSEPIAWPRTVGEIPAALGLQNAHDEGIKGGEVVVAVVDSGLDAAIAAQGQANGWVEPRIRTLSALNPTTDERGHGTAVTLHLHEVAPEATVRVVKFLDNSGWANYPVAGFQLAMDQRSVVAGPDPRRPDIVVCSWVMLSLSVALQKEIAAAEQQGTLVLFAAGNGRMHDWAPEGEPWALTEWDEDTLQEARNDYLGGDRVHAVAHPDALIVGGMVAFCDGSAPQPSRVATHYDSALFAAGSDGIALLPRQVPDVCGFVAPEPADGLTLPALTETRTPEGSTMDRKPDPAANQAGVVFTSGTSMAAAHVAGVAALVKQRYGNLTPRAIRNVLMTTASNESWVAATGWGLVRASIDATTDKPTALTWLVEGRSWPYLRATLGDWGQEGPERPAGESVDGLTACPDIIIRRGAWGGGGPTSLQAQLGLPAKHVPGFRLSEYGGDTVYLRITNRGERDWRGYALVRNLVPFDGGGTTPLQFRIESMTVVELDRVDAGDFVVRELVGALPSGNGVLVELSDTMVPLPPTEVKWATDLDDYVRASVLRGALYLGGA